MADEKQIKATADDEVARIIAKGEPGVQSAMKVLEITEKHYYAAVNQTAAPAVTTRAVSHS
jgi:hypothetical protein